MLKEKYNDVVERGKELGLKELTVKEEGGKLHIKGTAPYQLEKNLFWDKLKTHETWKGEVVADIGVEKTDIYGIHTVQSGDTLSKIAKLHLEDTNKYMEIFNLNTDILKDPNKIAVGQKLKLPNIK